MQVLTRKLTRKEQTLPMCRTDRSIHREVTEGFLNNRVGHGQWGRSMWIKFCDEMLRRGFYVELYEAKETVSKYITVYGNFDITFKIRFSNHAPSKWRMVDSDVNYWFGRNPAISHTEHLSAAIAACLNWFNPDEEYEAASRAREENRRARDTIRQKDQTQMEAEAARGITRPDVLYTGREAVHR